MRCPHCNVDFHFTQKLWSVFLGNDEDGGWLLVQSLCPACGRFVMFLQNGEIHGAPTGTTGLSFTITKEQTLVRPRGTSRGPAPAEVPPAIQEDYKEACLVLDDSPKASAALSRRCLQNLLRQSAGVKPSDLSNEIQQVLDSGRLPTEVAENIDAIRNIGNFAAHPTKSTSTGEIVPVEPDEAEWNLDVLESLFDIYFVQPARAKARRDRLNKKLQDAGKTPLK